MAMLPFKYYLHDESMTSEMAEFIASQVGLSAEEVDDMDLGRPFYEIGINCVLDTDNEEVLILGLDKSHR